MPAPLKYIISYSKLDSEAFARKLATELKQSGYPVWLDQLDIRPGISWDVAIQRALDEANTMLVILSQKAVESSNVMDEVSYGLNHGKTVIPILTEDCKIPYRLERIQYIDFRNDHDRGLEQLLAVMGGPAPLDKPAPEPVLEKLPAQALQKLQEKYTRDNDQVKTRPVENSGKPAAESSENRWVYWLTGGLVILIVIILFIKSATNRSSSQRDKDNIDTSKTVDPHRVY